MESKQWSFNGWKFWKAIKGTVKQVLIVGVPLQFSADYEIVSHNTRTQYSLWD